MERAVSALQDLTRRDILLRFYSDPAPKTAVDVAKDAGIHRSVAFDHLERLVSLGYLETELRRGVPGKPAKLYRLAQGPITVSHPPRQFGLLAQHLAIALDEFGPAGRSAAFAAGARLARSLEPSGSGSRSLSSCLRPLEALGAQFDLSDPHEIVITNCLFHEFCGSSPAVRRFQAGLLQALIEPSASGLSVEEAPLRERTYCRFRLFEGAQAEPSAAALTS